jgi:tellurite resistance protein
MRNHPLIKLLSPLARQMRSGKAPHGGDPALLFTAVVEAAFLTAAADGEVHDAERAAFKDAVRALAEDHISGGELETLLRDLADMSRTEGHAARCEKVGTILRQGHAAAMGLKVAAAVAYVSGGLSSGELDTLRRLAAAAHISHDHLDLLTLEMRPVEDL